MLEFLGTLGGNVLSLPGILGVAVGMTTRNIAVAAVLGGIVGIAEVLLFSKLASGDISAMELILSVGVGIAAGCVGSLIRRKGATV